MSRTVTPPPCRDVSGFDVVICAQAWLWLDRAVAIPMIADVLTPGGCLGVCWNAGREDDELTLRLADVYARVAPGCREPMLPGGYAHRT